MTSGLASDSDKFKIIITLRRAQKFGDSGPYIQISIFLYNPLMTKDAMFSFALTSGLASDSDKFKIIITLRRAQKFRDSGPYKNFDFLYYSLMTMDFCNFSRNLASF